jgi:hypothetical protein
MADSDELVRVAAFGPKSPSIESKGYSLARTS